MILREEGLQIKFPNGTNVRKFDDNTTHGLSHCMKAVDFIVELPECYYFIEFKDPDNPNAPEKERRKWDMRLEKGELLELLKYKYRDSFLYLWATDSIDKPVFYLVLLCRESLTEYEMLHQKDKLAKILPTAKTSKHLFKRNFVEDCEVFNLKTWNKRFPEYPISRFTE